jgi:hypothetical protein
LTFFENILNPTINWFGLTIQEPVTSATDFITSLVCLYSFLRLTSLGGTGKVYQLLRLYFLTMSVAMGFAAFAGHAFQSYLTTDHKAIGWSFSAVAICVLEIASAEIIKDQLGVRIIRGLQTIMILHLAIFMLLLLNSETRNFDMVKASTAIGLIGFVLPIHFYHWYKTRHIGSRWFVIAVLWAMLPAIVFNLEISVSRWFNFHDISHVLMAAYTLILFRGSKRFSNVSENV